MIVLGLETTCDETSAAVVHRDAEGRGTILANVVLSQIEEHAAYGGVVPEIAARAHVEVLDRLIAQAMREAGVSFTALDGVAAAAGPGLIGGLIVALTTAKAIALVHEKPLIAVNHLEGHALTARLTHDLPFPYCLFLASGGHTQIVAIRGVGDYVRLGTTLDDAIGEAFDKTAKVLGLPYPGGPQVEAYAARGVASRFALPRPMVGRPDADFSLSGLKTALRLEAEKVAPLSEQTVCDLCAAFQQAVADMVRDRLRVGLKLFRERFGQPMALVAAGGVAANTTIRRLLHTAALDGGTVLILPPPELCTDNGAMIAWAGAERLAHGLTDTLDVGPRPRWPLGDVKKPDRPAEPEPAPHAGPHPAPHAGSLSAAATAFGEEGLDDELHHAAIESEALLFETASRAAALSAPARRTDSSGSDSSGSDSSAGSPDADSAEAGSPEADPSQADQQNTEQPDTAEPAPKNPDAR